MSYARIVFRNGEGAMLVVPDRMTRAQGKRMARLLRHMLAVAVRDEPESAMDAMTIARQMAAGEGK